jgi:hypothetical protein
MACICFFVVCLQPLSIARTTQCRSRSRFSFPISLSAWHKGQKGLVGFRSPLPRETQGIDRKEQRVYVRILSRRCAPEQYQCFLCSVNSSAKNMEKTFSSEKLLSVCPATRSQMTDVRTSIIMQRRFFFIFWSKLQINNIVILLVFQTLFAVSSLLTPKIGKDKSLSVVMWKVGQ